MISDYLYLRQRLLQQRPQVAFWSLTSFTAPTRNRSHFQPKQMQAKEEEQIHPDPEPMASAVQPGRLGDPEMTLATEPRIHTGLLAMLKKHGIHVPAFPPAEMLSNPSFEVICDWVAKNEAIIENVVAVTDYTVQHSHSAIPITRTEEFIPGPDGNTIRLIIRRPSETPSTVRPAVLHFHSGGMIILSTDNAMHRNWAENLAKIGLVVISVDFRNALSSSGFNPFPAGLNDCAAAVRWVDEHREQLGISKVVLEGESGGANLALATALKANKEGWIKAINGVYADVPYISGAYNMPLDWKVKELPSLVECDGYLISCATSILNARVYDPLGENARNPLAWPFWATEEEMKGLPPHFILTSELDQLKDEGIAYYRKLVQAGVRAVGKMNLGIIHEAELFLPDTLHDLFLVNLWQVKSFADSL